MSSRDVGALAHEIPYWGWMTEHTCLTLSGELVTVGALAPVAVDGRAAAELDAVAGRWQQMLSGLPDGMRVSWIVERRAVGFPDPPADLGDIAALAQRKRHAFLADRVHEVTVHVVWCFNPRLRHAAERRNGRGGWLRARANPVAAAAAYAPRVGLPRGRSRSGRHASRESRRGQSRAGDRRDDDHACLVGRGRRGSCTGSSTRGVGRGSTARGPMPG